MAGPRISRSRRRGYRAEVELVDGIRRVGGEALRVAGSGHKTKVDVLASIPRGSTRRLFAFEVKTTEKESIWVPPNRVRALREFCRGFKHEGSGPIPLLAVKWTGKRRGKWTIQRVHRVKSITLKAPGNRMPRGLLEELSESKNLKIDQT